MTANRPKNLRVSSAVYWMRNTFCLPQCHVCLWYNRLGQNNPARSNELYLAVTTLRVESLAIQM